MAAEVESGPSGGSQIELAPILARGSQPKKNATFVPAKRFRWTPVGRSKRRVSTRRCKFRVIIQFQLDGVICDWHIAVLTNNLMLLLAPLETPPKAANKIGAEKRFGAQDSFSFDHVQQEYLDLIGRMENFLREKKYR